MITDLSDITSFKWATVTGTNPLAIKLDGDTSALALIPDSLVDPLELGVSDRVRVELSLRKCVIHGSNNGGAQSGDFKGTTRSTAPAGWMFMQGQSLLRADYPRLFAAIGSTYGNTSATTFTLPDTRGRVIVGQNAGQAEFNALGEKGGRMTTSHAGYAAPINSGNAQIGGSNYQQAVMNQMNDFLTPNGSSAAVGASSVQPVGGQISAAGTSNTEVRHIQYTAPNLQPYIALNYIIKL